MRPSEAAPTLPQQDEGGQRPQQGQGGRRRATDWLRKLAAVLLVLTSVTVGIIGLMYVTSGAWWGGLLIVATPFGIWLATRVTPEGGTTGYLDKNV